MEKKYHDAMTIQAQSAPAAVHTLGPLLAAALLLAGCPEETSGGFLLDTHLSDVIPTVVFVEWTTELGPVQEAHVDFGVDTSYGTRIEAMDDGNGTYSATLLGLRPSTDYHVRAAAVIDGTPHFGDAQVVTTGGQPSYLPEISIETEDTDRQAGGLLVTSVLTIPSAAAILDTSGHYVWWYASDEEHETWPITRARLSRDGQSMLFLRNVPLGTEVTSEGQHIVRLALDGSSIETLETPGVHNDFVELADGTLTVLSEDTREVEGETVVGDRILEKHPDGSETEIWSVWDDLVFDPEMSQYGHWTHANAIDLDEDTDTYYVGARHVNAIFKVDRAAGELLWVFGGPVSDFEPADEQTEATRLQHQFQVLEDGILVFDNREENAPSSRAVQFDLDEEAGTARQVWEYISEPAVYCYGMGDVTRLESGNTLVTWSSAGMVDEVAPDGEVIWRLQLDLGGGLGYVTRIDAMPGY
jgi:hypothetical protein